MAGEMAGVGIYLEPKSEVLVSTCNEHLSSETCLPTVSMRASVLIAQHHTQHQPVSLLNGCHTPWRFPRVKPNPSPHDQRTQLHLPAGQQSRWRVLAHSSNNGCCSGSVDHPDGAHPSAPSWTPDGQPASSSSAAEDEATGQQTLQQQQQQPAAVPWGLGTIVLVMASWLVAGLALAQAQWDQLVFNLFQLLLVVVPAARSSVAAALTEAGFRALDGLLGDVAYAAATAAILWAATALHRPQQRGLFSLSWRPWRQWVAPLAAGAGLLSALLCLEVLTSSQRQAYTLASMTQRASSDWLLFVASFLRVVVVVPFSEELMFRGFLVPSLAKVLPDWLAVLCVSGFFWAVQALVVQGGPASPLALPNMLLVSLMCGGAYLRTRSLLPPILLHSFWNLGKLVVFG